MADVRDILIEGKRMNAAREMPPAAKQPDTGSDHSLCAPFLPALFTDSAEESRQRARLTGADLPPCAAPDLCGRLLYRLKSCPPGRENWQVYQKLVGEILTALFCPPLDPVCAQNADADYRNRRDFVLPNYANGGYWRKLRDAYQAEFIVVDAKNSDRAVGKEDILQVAHYLKQKGPGLFGLIFSRRGMRDSGEQHLRDVWQNDSKMIVVLDDGDVEQMLLCKRAGDDPSRHIIRKIQEFRLRI